MGICEPYLGTHECNRAFLKDLETDDKKWKAYVAPILGDTDMVIFAFGADIGDWEDILLIIRSSSITRARDTIISAT